MLALNPSSQHHRSWPAVTNRDVPSNRSRSTARRSKERRKRRRRIARGRTRCDEECVQGKKGICQTTTAFFPRETPFASTFPLSTRRTTVNFDLATAAAVFLIRSRPAKRRERPFPTGASRRGVSDVKDRVGAPSFPFVRAWLPPGTLTGPRIAQLLPQPDRDSGLISLNV